MNRDKRLYRIFYNITSACNLLCRYCYANSKRAVEKENLPLDIVEGIAAEGKECGAVSVLLSGGEPFFRKDWFEVFSVFDKYGYELSVSSNGAIIRDETIEKIKKLKNVIFQISLDGGSVAVDKITAVKGTFSRVTAAVDKLVKNGYNVQLNAVLHRDNYDDIPFLIRYSYEKKVLLRLTLLNVKYGRASKNCRPLSLTQIIKVIKAIHIARTANPYIELNLPPLLLHPDDWFPISPSCGWMRHQCGILSNGDVTICGLVPWGKQDLIAGNVKRRSFKDIWQNSPLFNDLRKLEGKNIKGVCKFCPFLKVCGGSCRLTPYIAGGDFCAPDPFCQMFYEALTAGQIKENDFPSGVVHAGMFNLK